MSEPIISYLSAAESVVISTHTRPDGDGIGSQLALGRFLESKGKRVRIINSDPAPYTLDRLPDVRSIERFDGSVDQLEAIADAGALVVVDTNTEDRLGDMGPSFRGGRGTKILLDHHTEPETWFDARIVRDGASSTGEIVYDLLAEWDIEAIDAEAAHALYVAIMTDTGSFRFSNVTGRVHRIIADLIERGKLDTSGIHSDIFDRRSPEGLKLLSRVLATIEMHIGGQVGTMVINNRMLSETGASIEEAEGFVNYVLSIEGARVAMLFTETERGTKVSFRSKGDAHVHELAHALGGGGHRNAAGAFLRQDLASTRKLVLRKTVEYVALDAVSDADGDLPVEDAEYLSSLLKMQTRGLR
jgi:phosphoesterase RecJ-like protein